MRRGVLGWCVGGGGWCCHSREKRGRIIAKGFIQEAEGSDGAANYEARKPALRMYCLDGSLLHPVQPIQVGRSCPHPDDWAVLHNRPDKGFVGSKSNSLQVKCLAQCSGLLGLCGRSATGDEYTVIIEQFTSGLPVESVQPLRVATAGRKSNVSQCVKKMSALQTMYS